MDARLDPGLGDEERHDQRDRRDEEAVRTAGDVGGRHPACERERRVTRRKPAAERRPAARVGLRREHDDHRQDERDERQLRRRLAQPVEQSRRAVGDLPGEDEVADGTALTVAISTAPAAMSLASFAIGSNDVVAMSIAPSIAGVDHLGDQDERDRDQQRDQLELRHVHDQARAITTRTRPRSGCACSAACGGRG